MFSLPRHIELLLLEHNCVIVPGLGGFIANTASAVYNDSPDGDRLFMPPFRTIGFNPLLQINDGLLVQSYMQYYDASYPAAHLQMEKEIAQLNMQLNLCGEYTLEGIGTLHKSLDKGLMLTPIEAGLLTPSLYGTYSFSIKCLSEVERERQIKFATEEKNVSPIQTEGDLKVFEKPNDKEVEVIAPTKRKYKNNKKHNYWMDFAIAASIATIAFMTFLAPNLRNINGEQEAYIAGTIPANNVKNIGKSNNTQHNTASNKNKTEQPKSIKLEAEHISYVQPKNEFSTNKQLETDNQKVTQQEIAKDYTIVLASFVSEKNSNILIKNLADQGLGDAKFFKKGKTTRVIYSAYATEQEAYNALTELRKQNEAFADAWTLKLN